MRSLESYLLELDKQHKRWGFDKMMLKSRFDKKLWNHKRMIRMYCKLKLNIRVKLHKRILKSVARVIVQLLQPNICWLMDFTTDVLVCGRKFRNLNIIYNYNREVLLIEPSFSLSLNKVAQLVDQVAVYRECPEVIRVDSGSEFTSSKFKNWTHLHGIIIHFIQLGNPVQNGLIEHFNQSYRGDILNINLF